MNLDKTVIVLLVQKVKEDSQDQKATLVLAEEMVQRVLLEVQVSYYTIMIYQNLEPTSNIDYNFTIFIIQSIWLASS